MKKTLLTILSLFLYTQIAVAKNESVIYDLVKRTEIPKGSVSVSIKNVKTGKSLINHNADVQVSPASTQKILTYFSSIDTLGKDYNFSTRLYKTKCNDYYIVLGADPYLSGAELKTLLSKINTGGEVLKHLYIDDSIVDNINWGEGWQWDDGLNVLMPKFGAYNIDNNLYEIIVKPAAINTPANIFTGIFYPTTFINKTLSSLSENNLKLSKEENDISPDALTVSGNVSKTTKFKIPVPYLRRYFILRLEDALNANKIPYNCKFERVKVPANAELVSEITHPINEASTDILKLSNNMVAETIFKLAGGKYVKNTGTQASAIAMFNNYCYKNKINCSNIRLTDGSGVSKNNLINADFMTEFLIKIAQNNGYDEVKTQLPTGGEGTLTNRMILLKDKVYVKTGTLSNISGITGYIDTKIGNSYAFAIYITDAKSNEISKKMLEEVIIKYIYKNK